MRANELQLNLLEPIEHDAAAAQTNWQLRVSNRARTIRIQVYPHGGVEVVAPKMARPADIEAFVSEHRDWIARTRHRFMANTVTEPLLPAEIRLRAPAATTLGVRYSHSAVAQVREESGWLFVTAPVLEPVHCWPLLQHWLKQRARRLLLPEAWSIAAAIDLQPQRVHIRLQRSRWGSCSSSGTVSLNAALLLRTPDELRYVIAHELCHLRHMNHSTRYWKLVERYVPDYRTHEATLNQAWQDSPRWLSVIR